MIVLSILMCGLESREAGVITNQILHQLSDYPGSSAHTSSFKPSKEITCYGNNEVEFITFIDNGELPSGAKRQALVNLAQGKYHCFIDDDDEVSPDYISTILQGCRSNADVITFKLSYYVDRNLKEVWTFSSTKNYRAVGVMAANHLCAWKREIATQVAWSPEIGYGDDRLWFEPLHHSGRIKTQWHINQVLYHYYYSKNITENQSISKRTFTSQYFGRGLRCYDIAGNLFVENRHNPNWKETSEVIVRDKNNQISVLTSTQYQPFHTVK